MKKQSNTRFWARHIMIATVVLIVGVLLIIFLEGGFSLNGVERKSDNPADGMSRFYAEYRMASRTPQGKRLGDLVVEVAVPDAPLDQRLEDMESSYASVSQSWVGEYKYRGFRAGDTLRESISAYAQAEGMQVLWELDKDFIIKGEFQLQDTVVGSLDQISQSIGANFEGQVVVWFCPKQRSMVITDKDSRYLQNNCRPTRRY